MGSQRPQPYPPSTSYEKVEDGLLIRQNAKSCHPRTTYILSINKTLVR